MVFNLDPRQDFLSDGIRTSFLIDLAISSIDATQVVVWSENRDLEVIKTNYNENVDYTFTIDMDGLTYLIMNAPVPAGDWLTIYSDLQFGQATNYLEGDAMNPEVLERDLDRLHILGVQGNAQRSIRAPVDDGLLPSDYIIPYADDRKGYYLKFSPATGAPIMSAVEFGMAWQKIEVYSDGEIVEYNGIIYQAIGSPEKGIAPDVTSGDWKYYTLKTSELAISDTIIPQFIAEEHTVFCNTDAGEIILTIPAGTRANQTINIVHDGAYPISFISGFADRVLDSCSIVWNGSKWDYKSKISSIIAAEWENYYPYVLNDIVSYNGVLFRCIADEVTDNGGMEAPNTSAEWVLYQPKTYDTVADVNDGETITIAFGNEHTIFCNTTSAIGLTITNGQIIGHLVNFVMTGSSGITLTAAGIVDLIMTDSSTYIWDGTAWRLLCSSGGGSGGGLARWTEDSEFTLNQLSEYGGRIYRCTEAISTTGPGTDPPDISTEWDLYENIPINLHLAAIDPHGTGQDLTDHLDTVANPDPHNINLSGHTDLNGEAHSIATLIANHTDLNGTAHSIATLIANHNNLFGAHGVSVDTVFNGSWVRLPGRILIQWISAFVFVPNVDTAWLYPVSYPTPPSVTISVGDVSIMIPQYPNQPWLLNQYSPTTDRAPFRVNNYLSPSLGLCRASLIAIGYY